VYFAKLIDRISICIGRATAWLTLVMVLVTFFIVVFRYVFDSGWIWLQESVNWMHAAVFMLAAAYALARDEHVRVDIFYREFSPRGKAIVDAAGSLFLLLPVAVFLLWSSWDYVAASWSMRESSREAGGLVFPLVPLLKSFIPIMAVMLLLQALGILCRGIINMRSSS
jgi:TRAP-type mannitol/chloroaromatic compound transport system permease small subunit